MQSVPESRGDGSVIKIDETQLRGHVDEVVRSSVEETLNGMPEGVAIELPSCPILEGQEGPASLAFARWRSLERRGIF